MRSAFVTADQDRLTIGDGQFIDVKRRLSHGEREDMFDQMYVESPGGQLQLQRRAVRTATVLAYLIGWSLTDADGKAVPMTAAKSPKLSDPARLDTIRSLDPDVFESMYDAITAHIDRVQKARDAEKNDQDGKPDATATSPSVTN